LTDSWEEEKGGLVGWGVSGAERIPEGNQSWRSVRTNDWKSRRESANGGPHHKVFLLDSVSLQGQLAAQAGINRFFEGVEGVGMQVGGLRCLKGGCKRYRGADELLILADGGGSNGHRPRLWKASLQERIADRYGFHVTVCHYPTGASKWNPVEHRLFGRVSINWAGQPLRSLEILLGWVRGTEVGGVGVTASLDRATYPTKVKVSKAEMEQLDLERHEVCPAWNYTISPRHRALLN
jgi:hypothetical protein